MNETTVCGKEYGVGVKTTDCPREGRGSLCDRGRAKGLLGGVHHVEEAVLVPLPFVDLRDGGRHRDHAVAIDQEEESLVGVQLEAPPGGETTRRRGEEIKDNGRNNKTKKKTKNNTR